MEKKITSVPYSVSLDITYKCNLRCLHCFNSSGEHNTGQKEMTDEEILSICDDIVALKPNSVCICGGEPLLRKELVYKVISKITTGSNNNIIVNMVSNGELLTKEVAENLKKSGVTTVQISIDGGTKETHEWIRNKKGTYDKAINALRYLKEAGIDSAVSSLPTKRSLPEFKANIDICKSLGVTNFRTQPLMLLGRAKDNLRDQVLEYEEYGELVALIEELKQDSDYSNILIEWGDPTEHLMDEMQESLKKHTAIGINAYGELTVSPYIPLVVGNIKRHSLMEYWNNGLSKIVTLPLVKEITDKVIVSENMDLSQTSENIPEVYREKSLYLDIIDNKEDCDSISLEMLIQKVRL